MDTFYFVIIFIVGVILGLLISFLRHAWRPIAHLTISKSITEDGEILIELKNLSFVVDADRLSKRHSGYIAIHTKSQKIPPS